jgi:hypothetical protein
MRLPIFIPDVSIYNKNECSNLKFISSTGLIVSLAFDSKVCDNIFEYFYLIYNIIF